MSEELRMALTVIIGFSLYVWTLSKVAVRPVVNLLDERKATITKAFSDIETRQAQLTQERAAYENKLAHLAEQEVQRLQAASEEGERIARALEAEAKERYQELLVKAQADLDREVAKARIELRDRLALAASQAAEDLIRRELDAGLQSTLVDRYIEELAHVRS